MCTFFYLNFKYMKIEKLYISPVLGCTWSHKQMSCWLITCPWITLHWDSKKSTRCAPINPRMCKEGNVDNDKILLKYTNCKIRWLTI